MSEANIGEYCSDLLLKTLNLFTLFLGQNHLFIYNTRNIYVYAYLYISKSNK